VNEHDLHRGTLLVVVGCEIGLNAAYQEGKNGYSDQPRHEPGAQRDKAGRCRELDQAHGLIDE
jgi:hypothetical protein